MRRNGRDAQTDGAGLRRGERNAGRAGQGCDESAAQKDFFRAGTCGNGPKRQSAVRGELPGTAKRPENSEKTEKPGKIRARGIAGGQTDERKTRRKRQAKSGKKPQERSLRGKTINS